MIIGLLVGVWLGAPTGLAQTALRATTPLSEIDPADFLILEPAAEHLHELASEVATVLELRNGTVLIEVRDGASLNEDVSGLKPGHIRIAMDEESLSLTMGMARGEPLQLPLPLGRGGTMPDPRAVALAIETLRDPWLNDPEEQQALRESAMDSGEWLDDHADPAASYPLAEDPLALDGLDPADEPVFDAPVKGEDVGDRATSSAGLPADVGAIAAKPAQPAVIAEKAAANEAQRRSSATDPAAVRALERAGRPTARLSDESLRLDQPPGRTIGVLEPVRPFVYARAYTGASIYSRLPQVGVATGAGLCAVGHCLVLSTELPVTTSDVQDLRYRYVTFLSSFYSRPWTWGDFTPGASLGFLTRLGYFSQDMGVSAGEAELETDLGARASLELSWAAFEYVDFMLEGGVDVALDRVSKRGDGTDIQRSDLLSPWLQFALRVRPSLD